MAGKRLISQAAVQNPQHLMQILNAFADELSEVCTLINEIKEDFHQHTHAVTHAACNAASAAYASATAITSSTGPAIVAPAVIQKVQGGK